MLELQTPLGPRERAMLALNLTETTPGRQARRREAVRTAGLLLVLAIVGAIAAWCMSP